MKSKILVFIAVFIFFSCESNDDNNDIIKVDYPKCLDAFTDQIESFPAITPRADIKKYSYNGEDVYYIIGDYIAFDFPAVVVGSSCESICEFGGIAGVNTCPDFWDNATFIEVVWVDTR